MPRYDQLPALSQTQVRAPSHALARAMGRFAEGKKPLSEAVARVAESQFSQFNEANQQAEPEAPDFPPTGRADPCLAR